ncbi:MAG: hypothetical protein AB7H97_15060 [Pseudobdellovibrionaceae bacterium]
MKKYFLIYFIVTCYLGFEYFVLTYMPHWSSLLYLQRIGFFSPQTKFNTLPGRTISLWLGWSGLTLMVVMNLYSMRKRFGFMQTWGKLPDWLNFHIFCGLMGPTLIFFHCGLNVRGVVGISFWSMIVSLTSGIIGRYIFVQVSGKKIEFEQLSNLALERLNQSFENRKLDVTEAQKQLVLHRSLAFVGARKSEDNLNPFSVLLYSFLGDLRLLFSEVQVPSHWPSSARPRVAVYAINMRKAQFVDSYKRLMGYWHTFHFPLTVFMYIAAVIHVISSLIFLSPG